MAGFCESQETMMKLLSKMMEKLGKLDEFKACFSKMIEDQLQIVKMFIKCDWIYENQP